jgi:hypothetical protein
MGSGTIWISDNDGIWKQQKIATATQYRFRYGIQTITPVVFSNGGLSGSEYRVITKIASPKTSTESHYHAYNHC